MASEKRGLRDGASNRSQQAGFSLLEIILGLALLSLLMSITMVNTTTYMARMKQKEMRSRVVTAMELAREEVFDIRKPLTSADVMALIADPAYEGRFGQMTLSEGFRLHPPGACTQATGTYREGETLIQFSVEKTTCHIVFV